MPPAPPHRAPITPTAPAHRTRTVLAALVLAVLTLVGGASAAGATLPVALDSLAAAAAYPPKAPAPTPKTDRTAHPGGPHQELRRTRPAPSPAGPGTGGRNARDQRPGAGHPHASPAPPHAQSFHERSPAADSMAPTPRAGIGRGHLSGHAPPPSYDSLLTRPLGLVVPCGRAERAPEASFATPSGRRGALPGVRGPPGTSAGHPTGHRSCSADPASRPC
ncbi:hypothetical protein [Streptomyces sp. YIM 132580]|uniref:hypothetical protein n=1 Tax=Streptomyces sp. YIM 132580 TaxID=2691958 RepID=UPI00136BE7F1|nr:hypothetical protein [Streptomyces sp. YIM 132580]MXG26433.1 hypothetical protein [Streptomyces sp. YIM 132580]